MKAGSKNILRRYPLSAVLILAIWVVCMIPVPETPLNRISFIDKWTHFLMYGTLTLTLCWEYSKNHPSGQSASRSNWLCLCVVLPIVMGCLVELAQAYLTTCRSGDWFDALCNSLGVMLGIILYKIFAKIFGDVKFS